MKKLASIVLFCAVCMASYAQVKVGGGPKIGLNLASITNTEGGSIRPGLQIGAFLNLRFSDRFAFQPELLYSMQGIKADDVFNEDVTLKYDYLQIPLMAKFYLVKGFNLEVGPQLGILVNSKVSARDGGNHASVSTRSTTRKGDIGLGLGLGYDFDFGLVVGARYNIGLVPILKGIDREDNGNNSVAQIALGWKF